MNNINWNIFDKIYCTHYLPYTDRYKKCLNEFNRVNLFNHNFSWNYTVDNIFYDNLYSILLDHKIIFDITITNKSGDFKNSKIFNLAINVYNKL